MQFCPSPVMLKTIILLIARCLDIGDEELLAVEKIVDVHSKLVFE